VVMVTAASVQDRDGGGAILKRLHRRLRDIRFTDADDPTPWRPLLAQASGGSRPVNARVSPIRLR
jgi:hypothetical protein